MQKLATIVAASGFLACAGAAQAGTARLVLESNADRSGGAELFQASYASYADFLGNAANSTGFLNQDIGADYSVADIAYDHGAYRLLLESNADKSGGAELFVASYNSWADVLNNTASSTQFLDQDIGADYSVHGFTYDGDAYRLLLESNADKSGGAELFIASYSSYADFLGNTASATQFLDQDIGGDYSVAGLGFDNGAYRLLLESNADKSGGAELFIASYNSYADFLGNTASATQFLDQDIGGDYSVHGFEFETDPAGPGNGGGGVPEPATWMMMLAGFAGIGAVRRRLRPQVA